MSVPVVRLSGPLGDARLMCRFAHQLTVCSGVRSAPAEDQREYGDALRSWID